MCVHYLFTKQCVIGIAGKDPTKVDRSGAYIVRQAAKSIVAAGLARRVIVQVSSEPYWSIIATRAPKASALRRESEPRQYLCIANFCVVLQRQCVSTFLLPVIDRLLLYPDKIAREAVDRERFDRSVLVMITSVSSMTRMCIRRYHMLLELHNRCQCMWTAMALARSLTSRF